MSPAITLRGATEHNLRGVDLDLPHGEWIAVVGPSGSGKTSLVFDTLVREGQYRYLSSLTPRARQFFGKLGRAAVRELSGLPPTIAVGERALSPSARSTVGTLTGTLDLLRLLFARTAVDPGGAALTRSHFSFNQPLGACEACSGLGVEDRVDPALLVADPRKSLRDGALVPTLRNGYTVYSQVTLEVMDTICHAHGFDVHTPWGELTQDQRDVVLFGTRALKVPFGKHPIESRMRWEGITARPREEGYYRGLVPVIAETLKRNRNPNVLRFVRSVPCTTCDGSRLARAGREARIGERRLPDLLALPARDLPRALQELPQSEVLRALRPELDARLVRLRRLGLGHLALDRESTTLSGGEGQRLRLSAQLSAGLCGVLFALDEPTLGLHPGGQAGMRAVLDELRALGNTLAVIEHDPDLVRHADRIVRLGPGAGPEGGEVLSSGPLPEHPLGPPPTPKTVRRAGSATLVLRGPTLHNLRGGEFRIRLGALNVVIGPTGAGKSSLVFGTLLPALTGRPGGPFEALEGAPAESVRALDARPIGRTSRSTPATWSGLFELVRKRFAATGEARARGFGAGHFSYNNKQGRCASCEGLGTIRVGLHLFEDVELVCEACGGGRYAPEILSVRLRGKSIAEVLALSVREAVDFFADDPSIANLCTAMDELGLGYLCLGQPSNQLSRGESQRVKLATLLGTADAKPTMLLLDEPDRGLHPSDLALLIAAIDRLVEAGHTVVAISHHRHLWAAADHLTELEDGVIRAEPELDWSPLTANREPRPAAPLPREIRLDGVHTNNLRGVEARFPRGALTAICGVSGSGKSSLAFDTLAAEAWRRFAESLPFEVRRHVRRMPRPRLERASGLGPTLSLKQSEPPPGRRSTVATQSGLGPILRLLFSRAGVVDGEPCRLSAEHFSPDRTLGACPACEGRGVVARCDPALLVTAPERSLLDGALGGTRPGAFFSEPDGQHVATLRAALGESVDLALPWEALPERARRLALEGAGEERFEVTWEFAEDKREGSGAHRFEARWEGFLILVEREAARRAGHRNSSAWTAPLVDRPCLECGGAGIGAEARGVELGGRSLPELLELSLTEVATALETLGASAAGAAPSAAAAIGALLPEIEARLEELIALGLGHLSLGRRSQELSGGEQQRARLASVLRANLSGATLVLDEPSAGLQPDEARMLLASLRQLCAAGNTVVVVEHDPLILRGADHLIELGPGAGVEGGRLIGSGPPEELLAGDGPTARASRTTLEPELPPPDRERVRLVEVAAGPLGGIDLELPRSGVVTVTGPSGSGKSTLLFEVLEASFTAGAPVGCTSIELTGGLEHFRAVRGRRAVSRGGTVLTALELMSSLQRLFHAEAAGTELPRQAFSFRSPKGRCPACGGSGRERVAMDFMADLDLPCPTCEGRRYRPEVLAVRWGGFDVAQFLEQPVGALASVLPSGRLRSAFEALSRVGLGHLSAGREVTSLSGGEVQRLALAKSLSSRRSPALHLFDEPAAGQHLADLSRLVEAFRELADRGDLVVVVDHHAALVAASDLSLCLGLGENDGFVCDSG